MGNEETNYSPHGPKTHTNRPGISRGPSPMVFIVDIGPGGAGECHFGAAWGLVTCLYYFFIYENSHS